MTRFGAALRAFRQASNDPDRLNRRLTQERLGELIGHEMGDLGFSGAAISYWESGESKINAEDRNVLIALIKVLHRCGGLQTLVDANQLLEAGHYSALQPDEAVGIFGKLQEELSKEQTDPAGKSRPFHPFLPESLFAIFGNELTEALVKAEEGPSPAWPRKVAVLMRTIARRVSLSLSSIFWIAAWALAWWLIPPSLRWPFADQGSAYSAIIMYVGGTLAVPLLIGLLVTTKDSDYWKQQSLTTSRVLRLYTYQGAGIGFNLGYFFVFPFVLARYYLDLESSIWLELAAVTLGLILGNMAARVVPHNLWLAYGRLHLVDGAVFFVVALLGPLWGLFFRQYYMVLLTPLEGSIVILTALALLIIVAVHQSKKTDTKQA